MLDALVPDGGGAGAVASDTRVLRSPVVPPHAEAGIRVVEGFAMPTPWRQLEPGVQHLSRIA
ncbi:hypothetical protein ABK046_48215, partial [Streptomyces caeruleatus]